MYHPTTRLLTILELLQARSTMNGAELAQRLEVDRRTVRKYIMMLQDLGIPIETTRGATGGYSLRPGFKLPPLMLTNDEALAVTLSLIAARRQGIPADPHWLEGALAKIERVLPASLRSQVQAVQSTVEFVVAPAIAQPASETVLLLSNAVQLQRAVHLRYQGRGEETERRVDPYGVVSHWEHWYLVGWCHLRQDIRVFRLDRIETAVMEEATFSRPDPFDSLHYVLDSLATAPRGWSVEILVETTVEEAERRIPRGYAVFEDTAEGVIMRLHTTDLAMTARYLLWLRCPLVIRQPSELREALRVVAAEAQAMADRQL